MNFDQLESLVSRKLASLPGPRAPATLLPRILDELEGTRRSTTHQRPWDASRRMWQAASLAALAVLAWLASAAPVREASGEAAALVGAARVLWEVFLEPNAVYFATAAGVLGATSALFCAALSRLLSEGSPE